MTPTHRYTERDDAAREAMLRRLKRIEGQVRGLQQMVADDRYCIDVLTQVAATTSALQSVALGLLDDHLHSCVRDAVQRDTDVDDKLSEVSESIARLVKA